MKLIDAERLETVIKSLFNEKNPIISIILDNIHSQTAIESDDWISVTDRLPEECHNVLVYCPTNNNIWVAHYFNNKWIISTNSSNGIIIDEPVTKWQALPLTPSDNNTH
jgi:hypothetical protein